MIVASPCSAAAGTFAPSQLVTCGGYLESHERSVLDRTLWVCPGCDHHLRLTARAWLRSLVDEGSFAERDARLRPGGTLRFVDRIPYPARARAAQLKTGERDAMVTGCARLCWRT